MLTLEDLTVPAPPPGRADWNAEGVVIRRGLLNTPNGEDAMRRYEACWLRAHGGTGPDQRSLAPPWREPGGWPDPIPYMRHPEILDLLALVAPCVEQTVGETMAVNLNLTGWVSTERDWHQDGYLNPPGVGDHYAAVWIALQDVDPDSGPFQYVPGSHRWPQVTQERILDALGMTTQNFTADWPSRSEKILTPLFTEEIENAGVPVSTYLPNRGDVLVWHGRLLHRGSKPRIPGTPRKALIAHFSGTKWRPDMPAAKRYRQTGLHLFPLQGRALVGDERYVGE